MHGREYSSQIDTIQGVIDDAISFQKNGNLIKAANLLQSAGSMLMKQLEDNPKQRSLLKLKVKYEKCRNQLIQAMINDI